MKSIWKSEDKCTTTGCAFRHDCTTIFRCILLFISILLACDEESSIQLDEVVHLDTKCTGGVVHFGKAVRNGKS